MKTHARIIFWVILLFVGLQWIVSDSTDTSLTGGSSLTAVWDDLDDSDLSDSHHHGIAFLTDSALWLPHIPIAGPALFVWLLASPDSTNLQHLAVSHRIPRSSPIPC